MDLRPDILNFLRENPGSSAVDMLLARVGGRSDGTLIYFTALKSLLADGLIQRAPNPDLDLWIDHVQAYPKAHLVGSGLDAFQATRWVTTP